MACAVVILLERGELKLNHYLKTTRQEQFPCLIIWRVARARVAKRIITGKLSVTMSCVKQALVTLIHDSSLGYTRFPRPNYWHS